MHKMFEDFISVLGVREYILFYGKSLIVILRCKIVLRNFFEKTWVIKIFFQKVQKDSYKQTQIFFSFALSWSVE